MKTVLIGYGYWGKILQGYIEKDDRFELLGICDPVSLNSVRFEEILEDREVEAAFVCTPINTHYEIVRLLLEHKKHVFCEKPLCKNEVETIELFQIAKDRNTVLFTDYIYTFSQTIQYMKAHLYELGKINYIEASIKQFGRFYPNDDVYDVLGVHFVSSIIHLFDKELYVKKVCNKQNISGLCLDGRIIFKIKNIEGEINSSLTSSKKERTLKLICEHGIMVFDMLSNFTFECIEIFPGDADNVIREEKKICKSFDESNNLKYALDEFYQAIKTGLSNDELVLKVVKAQEQIKKLILG